MKTRRRITDKWQLPYQSFLFITRNLHGNLFFLSRSRPQEPGRDILRDSHKSLELRREAICLSPLASISFAMKRRLQNRGRMQSCTDNFSLFCEHNLLWSCYILHTFYFTEELCPGRWILSLFMKWRFLSVNFLPFSVFPLSFIYLRFLLT